MLDFAEFELYLLKRGNKASTIRTTVFSLRRVLGNARSDSVVDVNNFLLSLHNKGLKNKYLNHLILSVHLWGQFKKKKLLQKIPLLKEEEYIKATMSDEEIETFLKIEPPMISYRSPKGTNITRPIDPKSHKLWTTFFSIMAFTGMRPGEVAHLLVQDVDFGRGVFVLTDTKTNTPRNVPIPPNIIPMIKEHLESLKGDKLFPARRGNQDGVFNDVQWNYNFHSRIRRLGIKRRNLTPYSLRHSFITRMLEEDINIFKIQKIVGHRRLETTAHYTHLTTKDIVETIKKHPLVRKGTSPTEIIKAIYEMLQGLGLHGDNRLEFNLSYQGDELFFKVKSKLVP